MTYQDKASYACSPLCIRESLRGRGSILWVSFRIHAVLMWREMGRVSALLQKSPVLMGLFGTRDSSGSRFRSRFGSLGPFWNTVLFSWGSFAHKRDLQLKASYACSLLCIVCKRALWLVALLRKETCNLRHPMHVRHSVSCAKEPYENRALFTHTPSATCVHEAPMETVFAKRAWWKRVQTNP